MDSHTGSNDELLQLKEPNAFLSRVLQIARSITGAEGAAFVLRDGDYCYYADEDAISPLWKGKRFPLRMCLSGWVILNKMPAAIEDIYLDIRVPVEAYRPTFVKSLAMVPVHPAAPVAAIGSYWAQKQKAAPGTMLELEQLAARAATALEDGTLLSALLGRGAALPRNLGP